MAVEKAYPDKKPIISIWIIDGEPQPSETLAPHFIYRQSLRDGGERLVIRDGEGGFIGVTEEEGQFVLRQKAFKGKAVSFAEWAKPQDQEPTQ